MASGRIMKALHFPIVVILGATGTGKSKLAIDIALKYNGEIISADAMQVYKGLDIITNKVTSKEQELCKHHMIGLIHPTQTNFTVVEFQSAALKIIEDLHLHGRLPVIVGGTNYYIESLLWHTLLTQPELKTHATVARGVDSRSDSSPDTSDDSTGEINTSVHATLAKYQNLSTSELHKRLTEVDETSAQRIHPHNRRKIIRALDVYDQHNVTMTTLYAQQHGEEGEEAVSGSLRFLHPCILYLQCDQTILDERLDRRVDKMMQQGFVEELTEFHRDYNSTHTSTEGSLKYTEGIFQSIGFKEFHPYLLLTQEERETEQGQQSFVQCAEDMKRATRRYSRSQLRWVRKRFLTRRGRSVPPVYSVDCSHPELYQSQVLTPAASVVAAYLQGETPPTPALPRVEIYDNRHVHNVCDICGDQIFVTEIDWQAHLNCRRHKKRLQKLRRDERRREQCENSGCECDVSKETDRAEVS